MSGWLLMGLPGLAYLSGFDVIWLVIGLIAATWEIATNPIHEETD